MKLINEMTIKGITLQVYADSVSKYYLNSSDDIKQIDEDYMLHNIQMLRDAKKKGVFKEVLVSITDGNAKKLINNDMKWLNNQKTDKLSKGSLYTMLSNKGF